MTKQNKADKTVSPVREDRSESLNALFRPTSIAVIGASSKEGSLGGMIFTNLVRDRFKGPVYPVNQKSPYVHSTRAYHSVSDIPDEIDLAVIAVPHPFVHKTMLECAAKGVRAVVVITAGFKETGAAGAAEEERLLEVVRSAGMRMVGPNCMGIISTDPEICLDATFSPTAAVMGSVAVGTQSGALGVVMLDYARGLNIGISDFVSMGNKTDVSGNDLLRWWENEPRTNVILLYLESFGNQRTFFRLARRVNRKKPIVAVKSGRSRRGLQAASSHTGSLAGTDVAVAALLTQTGVIRVDTVDELFDMAAFLAHQPVPAGRRLAILTNAGGPGILATDACEAWGLEIPDLEESIRDQLAGFLPSEASLRNPVDMIASAGPEAFENATRVLLQSENIDALLVIAVHPPFVRDPELIGRGIARGAEGSKKPVISCLMGRQGIPEALTSLNEAKIPSYAFPESGVRTLSRACRYGEWLERPEGLVLGFPDIDRADVGAALDSARGRLGDDGGWLTPDEVDTVLQSVGIRTPESRFAETAEEAIEMARELSFPVVMKIVADGIEHKTDVGGVRIDLRTEAEIDTAYAEMAHSLEEHGLRGRMRGVHIQKLVQHGVEAIIGVNHDAEFGHLIMFGLGGVNVELLKDVCFRIAPVTTQDTLEMVRSVRGYPILEGYRGAPHSDTPKLEETIQRISTLVSDFPEISEMDLNPVKVLSEGEGCVAVDARILLGPVIR